MQYANLRKMTNIRKAKIQGIHPTDLNNELTKYSLGVNVASLDVDSSNPFYTTKVSNLVISATTYTAPDDPNDVIGSMDVVFSGTPDLSEVMVGNRLDIMQSSDPENVGVHYITGVNDGTDTITVEIRNGKTNASATGYAETMPFIGGYAALCKEDTSGLLINGESDELTTGITEVSHIEEATISTSGRITLNLI